MLIPLRWNNMGILLLCFLEALFVGCSKHRTEVGKQSELREVEFKDSNIRPEAIKELEGLGRNGVPALMKALKDTNGEIREHAARALWKLGREATDAVPVLIEAWKNANEDNRHVVQFAGEALVAIGRASVPSLVEIVLTGTDDYCMGAAMLLASIREDASDSVPALMKALTSRSSNDVRYWVVQALENIGRKAKDAIPLLIDLHREGHKNLDPMWDPMIVGATGSALVTFGRDAVPQLVLSLRNSRADVDVRIGTAAILGQIGPEAADAVQDLKNLLNDPQLGEAAASALKQIDHPASTAKD